MRKLDLVGQRFGLLVVVSQAPNIKRKTRWNCLCDCGASVAVLTNTLRSGTKSCGHLRQQNHITHGMSLSRLYPIWSGMKSRCENPNREGYKWYGARGIKVCEAWRVFEAFAADMGPTYAPGLSIDRIDNDGNYEPGNCRWATAVEQVSNRRVSPKNRREI